MTLENSQELPDRTPSYIIGRRQSRETLIGLLYEYASKSNDFQEAYTQYNDSISK